MTMIRDITVHLGPREVVINGRVIAMIEDITVGVEEATEEELADLTTTPVILLVKPLPRIKGKEEPWSKKAKVK